MEPFEFALKETILDEGKKLSKLDGDPGGQTYYGIARAFHPTWPGWVFIDAGERDTPRLNKLVEVFYDQEFWQPIKGDRLPAFLAYHVFDFAVNSDPQTAAMKLQEVLGCAKVDGVIGEKETIPLAWYYDEFILIAALNAKRELYLASLKNWPLFGKGWVNRVAGNTLAEALRRRLPPPPSHALQTAPTAPASSAKPGAAPVGGA